MQQVISMAKRLKDTISNLLLTLGLLGFQVSFVEVEFIGLSQGLHSQEGQNKNGEDAIEVEHHGVILSKRCKDKKKVKSTWLWVGVDVFFVSIICYFWI
jgi:hypothetical protein